jgi:hypothetical protein
VQTMQKPQCEPGLFNVYYQYNDWKVTDTPRECAGLERVFAVWGLDKLFWLPPVNVPKTCA